MLVRGFIRGFMRGLKRGLGASVGGRQTIVGALLTQYESNADGSTVAETYVTSSYTPVAGRKQYALVVQTGTTCNLPSSLTGNGLTWTEKLTNNKGGAAVAMGLYEATAGTPVAGALTAVFAAGDLTTGAYIHVFEFTGVDLTTPIVTSNNVQTSAGAALGATSTLPNALENTKNAHFYMMSHAANEGTTNDDFTELSDNAHLSPVRGVACGYKANDLTAALTWATSSASRWMAVELKSA